MLLFLFEPERPEEAILQDCYRSPFYDVQRAFQEARLTAALKGF